MLIDYIADRKIADEYLIGVYGEYDLACFKDLDGIVLALDMEFRRVELGVGVWRVLLQTFNRDFLDVVLEVTDVYVLDARELLQSDVFEQLAQVEAAVWVARREV